MAYLVGIDSGGTHTNIQIISPEGGHQHLPEIRRSLTSNRSDDELMSALQEIFAAVRMRTFGEKAFIWISAAGYANSTRDQFLRLLGSIAKNSQERVGIGNDAITLLLAHEAETIIVIAGTGSACMSKLPTGKVIAHGGDEWVAADVGSAFWIGLVGIRAAYKAIEGGPDSALRRSLVEQYRPLASTASNADERQVVQEIVRRLAGQGTATKPVIAQFAGHVTRQAELGDEVAQAIVQQAAAELASSARIVYRELAEHASPRPVVPRFILSGAVGHRSRFYAESFEASLNQKLFDVRQHPDEHIDIAIQLDGIGEALELARRLQVGDDISDLDDAHSHSVIDW